MRLGLLWGLLGVLFCGPAVPVSALTKAQIKRGPSYRDSAYTYGGAIRLNKTSFSWTDRIEITIIAPMANLIPYGRDVIGDGRNGTATVKTKKGRLENYRFVETGANTGIFVGYVTLSGFKHDIDGDGKEDTRPRTTGQGPFDGVIEVDDRRDGLSIYWKPDTGGRFSQFAKVLSGDMTKGTRPSDSDGEASITQTVSIGWSQARLAFDRYSYTSGGRAHIRVLEPDMNLNPGAIDSVQVFVFSESDWAGVNLFARETAPSSGVFEGAVTFSEYRGSGGSRLRARPGDKVFAIYKDRTLPKPYGRSDELKIEAVARLD